jgi:hypothetical protein
MKLANWTDNELLDALAGCEEDFDETGDEYFQTLHKELSNELALRECFA